VSPTALLPAVLAVLAALVPFAAAPAVAATDPAPVVLVGTGGVRWSDVDTRRTPTLAGLLREGAVADVAVRSVRTATCPVEGWLAVSAGRRAGDARDPRAAEPGNQVCRPMAVAEDSGGSASGTPANVQGWPRYAAAARAEKFDATPGLLGDALTRAGRCGLAVGPGAAVALARTDGSVARYLADATAARAQLAAPSCPLTVVDVGAVRDPADTPRGAREQGVAATSGDRAAQVAAVDAALGRVLADVPAGVRVLVASLADSGRTPHLQLLAARGSGFGPGLLRTASTRQDALVQATDLTPTLLDLLGVPAPTGLVGSPLRTLAAPGAAPASADDRLRKVLDLDQAAQQVRPLVGPFFTGLVVAQLLLYGLAALALRHRWTEGPARSRVLAWVRRLSVVFATVPVSTYLANTVPWWRSTSPLLVVVLAVLGYVAVLSAVALLGPWRRAALGPLGAVSGLTAAVLAGDILSGSRLQTASLMGLQPVVAGRFYGFSNVAFALFATGALLLATAVADALVRGGRRRAAAAAVAGIGVVATALDVSPAWGSDFGGPIGMVPAFAVLTLLVLGLRLSWRRLLLIGIGTVAVLTAVSVADWLRPPEDQTHLGRFVQTVIDGGALQVIARKGQQNLSILASSPLSLLIPFAAVFVALVLMRPSSWGARALQQAYDRSPTLRHGLVCLLLLLGIGFAVNDSGTVIPAIGATLAIPLVIAASMRALEDGEPPQAPPARQEQPDLAAS
jgi:hypothetical protein